MLAERLGDHSLFEEPAEQQTLLQALRARYTAIEVVVAEWS